MKKRERYRAFCSCVKCFCLAAIVITGFATTSCKEPQVDANPPAITTQPVGATVAVNATHSLSVTAKSRDGGTLSYQWYSNTSATNTGGILSFGIGARSASYTPSTNKAGTYYFFVEVKNTIPNNGDGGKKTATVRSNAVEFCVLSPSEIVIDLTDINEWGLTEQTAQATANVNKVFAVTGTYTTYRWYLNGVSVGTSSGYTFNRPVGVYELVVVVTNSDGESRSGRCRITVGES